MLKGNLSHKKGQGLVEYALLLVLVAIVCIAAITVLGTSVSNIFGQLAEEFAGGGGGAPPPGGTCYGSLLLPYLIGSTILFLLIFKLAPQRSTAAIGV
jgi:pilus assembly protein Flp/PilA